MRARAPAIFRAEGIKSTHQAKAIDAPIAPTPTARPWLQILAAKQSKMLGLPSLNGKAREILCHEQAALLPPLRHEQAVLLPPKSPRLRDLQTLEYCLE